MDHMETMERLTTENARLQRLVLKYQRLWCIAIDLVEKIHQAIIALQAAIENCIAEDIAAEKKWLASGGIKTVSAEGKSYGPAGWI